MNVRDPVSTIDGLLAATAKVCNCILVTRNVKDINRCGVTLPVRRCASDEVLRLFL